MHQRERVIRNIKGKEQIVNFVFGSGVLTANPPQIKEIKGYKVMKGFGFSIKFSNGKGKLPTYYALELWGDNAEYMARLGFKNQLIEVVGREQISTYRNQQGEMKELKILVVEKFTCLERKEQESMENVEDVPTDNNKIDTNIQNVGIGNEEFLDNRTFLIENPQDDVPF